MSASDYLFKYGVMSPNRDPYATHDDSDLTIARIAENTVADRVRRVEKLGTWLQWSGHYWKETDSAAPVLDDLADVIERQIQNLYTRKNTQPLIFWQEFSQWKKMKADASPDERQEAFEGVIKTEKAIANKLKMNASRNSIMAIVGQHLKLDTDDLDANVNKVVFRNGYFDCETGGFHDNEMSQYATLCIDIDYDTPDEKSRKNVKDYLDNLGFDEETLEYMQRSFGYSLTGQGSEKHFWWFRGIGNTSKSTLINMVAECMGTYAYTTNADTWVDKGKQGPAGHTEEIAVLRGRRLVLADEFPKKARLNGALMKRVTSGSTKLNASRKGEKSFQFKGRFGLFFASNFDCQADQGDGAFMDRISVVTFQKKIEQSIKDERFIEKFLKKDQNRLAFLEWILQGAMKYCESGLGVEPEHLKSSRQAFKDGQVSIEDQLREILESDPKAVGNKSASLTQVMEALANIQKSTRQTNIFTKKDVVDGIKLCFLVDLSTESGHTGFNGLTLKNSYSPKRRNTSWDAQLDWGYAGDYESGESN